MFSCRYFLLFVCFSSFVYGAPKGEGKSRDTGGFRHAVALREWTATAHSAPAPVRPARQDQPPQITTAVRELGLQPAVFTPYDRYMDTVRAVLASVDGESSSMLLACELMRKGRRFRYVLEDPYRANPPAVTARKHAGDCKSKALWLYRNLGDGNALYVIGKAQRRAANSHAWVYWRHRDRWWILDPTNRSNPIAADSVSSDRYVPYYSYGKAGAFRHPATRLLMASGGEEAVGERRD